MTTCECPAYTDATVSVATTAYNVHEANGMVEVCAKLTSAPDDGLECSIVATLQTMDGPKASKAGETFVECLIAPLSPLFFSERL